MSEIFKIPILTEEGEELNLSAFQGKWLVLYVYPKDNTPGCTTEAKEFSALLDEFRKLNAEVVGVSRDPPKSHRKFRERHGLKVILVSDPDAKLIKALGAWGIKKMYGKVREGVIRSTFIISPSGEIVWSKTNVRAKGHAAKVLDILKSLVSTGSTPE